MKFMTVVINFLNCLYLASSEGAFSLEGYELIFEMKNSRKYKSFEMETVLLF
jgi:hypothetical protein